MGSKHIRLIHVMDAVPREAGLMRPPPPEVKRGQDETAQALSIHEEFPNDQRCETTYLGTAKRDMLYLTYELSLVVYYA